MAHEYQPRRFFRQVPNRLLRRYFSARNVLRDVDFDALTETQIEPIYEAWLNLPEDARNEMEQDFQDIDELAREGGSKAILDEGRWHGEDLAEQFAKLTGFPRACLLDHSRTARILGRRAGLSSCDMVPASYLLAQAQERTQQGRQCGSRERPAVRKNLGHYFHTMQGRGVDCYRRNHLDYFFAYPQDYAQASVEWVGKEFKRRSHHPAFELIFVYSQTEGTLDIYLTGDRKPVPDLQVIFADVILKAELGPDEEDERVYDLSPMRSRTFHFTFGIESGIADVAVKKLRLKVHGKSERIAPEADHSYNKHAVFDLLDKVTKAIPLAQMGLLRSASR